MIQPGQLSDLPPHSDNVDEELRRIELALDAVFSATPHAGFNPQSSQWWEQRQLADRYLTSFQSSAVSWIVCDRLLQSDNGNDPVKQQQRKFFAAQTLHTKCRSDAFQLNPADLPALRDSLLNHLGRHALVRDTALTTRLAMCISALAVQMSWTTIVTDLLGEQNAKNRIVCMSLLKVLPEECASDRLILVDENIRYRMRDHFVSSSSMVFRFLQTWDGEVESVYEVCLTWIRYVPVPPTVIMESPLLDATVHAVTEPQNLEIAVDVLVEILRMYPSHHPANQGLVQKMIPLLSKLPLDQALQSDDEDVLRAYCRVVTEMGESYMSLILSTQYTEASQLVEWVLRCSGGIAETEIASITLHFWYRMVLDLESVEPYDFRQDLVDRYTPHLLELISICVTSLMKYPLNLADLAEDRVDDLHRDRFYVSETIEDCCRLLGGQVVLNRIGSLLQNECRRVEGSPHMEWQGVESCLNCIQAIHRFIPSDEAEFLPFAFQLIPKLPPEIAALRFTASKTIGKYASWLAAHPQLLAPLLPFLAQGLSIPLCAPAAAVAIKELCECSNQQMSMGEPVLQLYNEISANPGRLDLKDELEVLEGVCRALSRQIQDTRDSGTTAVQRIVQPIGSRLATSVQDQHATTRQHIIPEIERLTVIVRFLTVPPSPNQHPIVNIVSSSWNLLDAACNRFPQDNVLAEKVCRLHKHALRAVGAVAYAPMLDALMEQLVRSYERSHQSPFLYAASICVTEYGRDPSYSLRLFDMIGALAATSFSFLRNLEDLTAHPDVVEEFFYLMGRMMSHCPDPLVKSPLLLSLFQCAVVGMQLDHRDANKGTLNFLENTVSYGLSLREQNKPDSQASLEHVLTAEGQAVVNNLARALMGDLPAYSVDTGHGSVAGILWKLNLLCPSLLVNWMSMALNTAPERVRGDFMGALESGLAREDFNLAVRAFMSAIARHRRMHKIPSARA